MRPRRPLTTAAVALTLTACSSMANMAGDHLLRGGVAAAAASAVLPIGYDEEVAYGGAIAAMIVSRYGGLVEEPSVVTYVNTVGHAVAAFSERPDIPYHFGVLDTDEVNALSAPGGWVFLTRGALLACADEAQLAGLLAHEVGHIAGRHALAIIQKVKAKNQLLQAVGAYKDSAALAQLVDGYVTDALERGLPQPTELDADRRGTETLARVGYDARALRDFLADLKPRQADTEDRFWTTHPPSAKRIAKLDALLAALGEAADGARNAERFKASVAALHRKPVAPDVPTPGPEGLPPAGP